MTLEQRGQKKPGITERIKGAAKRTLENLPNILTLPIAAMSLLQPPHYSPTQALASATPEFTVSADGKLLHHELDGSAKPIYFKAAWPYIAYGPNIPGILRPECAALRGTTQEIRSCMDFGNENFDAIVTYPERLRRMGYNAIVINAYWDQLDTVGKGEITDQEAMDNINRLIKATHEAGMYNIIKFQTSAVDVGAVPSGFFKDHPDAIALNQDGQPVHNWQYKAYFKDKTITNTNDHASYMPVPSINHPAYIETTNRFMQNFLSQVDTDNLALVTPDIEPQYYSDADTQEMTDFSPYARDAYIKEGYAWPPTQADLKNPESNWNKWRARQLAKFSFEHAKTIKAATNNKVPVSVIHFVATGDLLAKGNSEEFLRELSRLDQEQPAVDIIEANWHEMWAEGEVRNAGFKPAYQQIREINATRKRKWGATAYMTWVGTDFDRTPDDYARQILEHDIQEGTKLGMMVLNTRPNSQDTNASSTLLNPDATYPNSFSTLNDDWTPKRSGRILYEGSDNINPSTFMAKWVKLATNDTTPPNILSIRASQLVSSSMHFDVTAQDPNSAEVAWVQLLAESNGQLVEVGRAPASVISGTASLNSELIGFNGPITVTARVFDGAGNGCDPKNCGNNTVVVDAGNTVWQRSYMPLIRGK